MKKFTFILLLCLLPASFVFGQVTVGGFGSYCMPMSPSDFKDYWGGGIGFGGEAKLGMGPNSAVVVTFHMLNFKLDSDALLDEFGGAGLGIDVSGGNIKGWALTGNFLQYLTPPGGGMGFYVTAGAGYYSLKPDDITMTYQGASQTISGGDAETGFGVNGGVGIEFALSSFSIFAEGRYHYTFIEMEGNDGKVTFITIKGGVRVPIS